MVPGQVKSYLDQEKVAYEVLPHGRAFTAQGVAAALHVSGREFAKAVIARTQDGRLLMAVIPGPRHLDLKALQDLAGARVQLAAEQEFARLFPGCETGAEPPFGNLYGLPVYVDESLTRSPDIVFNAGSHTEAIRMKYEDYERLVKPVLGSISSAN